MRRERAWRARETRCQFFRRRRRVCLRRAGDAGRERAAPPPLTPKSPRARGGAAPPPVPLGFDGPSARPRGRRRGARAPESVPRQVQWWESERGGRSGVGQRPRAWASTAPRAGPPAGVALTWRCARPRHTASALRLPPEGAPLGREKGAGGRARHERGRAAKRERANALGPRHRKRKRLLWEDYIKFDERRGSFRTIQRGKQMRRSRAREGAAFFVERPAGKRRWWALPSAAAIALASSG